MEEKNNNIESAGNFKDTAEEKAPEAEEIKKVDKEKALKSWFKSKPEDEKDKKEQEKLIPAKKAELIKNDKKDKTPRNWRRIKLITMHTIAILILAISVATNVCLYKKYKEIKNASAEQESAMCVSQQNIDKEKLDNLTAQVEKLVASMNETKSVPATPEKVAEAIKVAIYNGTATAGLAKEMEKTLKEKISDANVVALDNAKHSNYTKTLVMALNGKTQEAQKIAQAIGGQLSIVPMDETKPNADVLVIVGK